MSSSDIAYPDYWDHVWSRSTGAGRINLRPWNFEYQLWDSLLKELISGSASPSRLLEIGCAPGRWMVYFHKNLGLDVWGIDYSKRGVDVTRQNLEDQRISAVVVEGDFLQYEFPVRFDAVVSFGVIEHYKDPVPLIRKCHEDLKDGGICVCSIPNIASGFYGGLQRLIDRPVWEKHAPYNLEDLMKFFLDSGFDGIQGTYYGSFNLGVVNVSRFPAPEPFMFALNLVSHLLYRSVSGRRESRFWSPYIFVWGRR